MSLPFFYKGLGNIKKATLDNKLMDNYQVVLEHVQGTSLDMFAYQSCRATTCNQFDPERDWPQPRPDTTEHKVELLHAPVLADQHEPRNLLWQLRHERYDVTLIDPPFTPLQQTELYGSRGTELLNSTHAEIETLYRLSLEYAFEHTAQVILLYGYKCPCAPPPWQLAALWAIGGGSHPAIHCCMYTRIPSKQLVHALTENALALRAEVSVLTRCQVPGKPPPLYHMGTAGQSQTWALAGKADVYKKHRQKHEPKSHPAYLSQAMAELAQTRPVTIHCPMATLYKKSKKHGACFVGGVEQRSFYTHHAYGDITYVLLSR